MKTLREELNELSEGQGMILCTPKIEHMLTGVIDARISRQGEIKLTYEDGTEQRASAPDFVLDKPTAEQSLFSWVDFVQGEQK